MTRASGAELDAGRAEIARFLASRPPFTTLTADELAEVVSGTQVEFHLARAVILSEDGGAGRRLGGARRMGPDR